MVALAAAAAAIAAVVVGGGAANAASVTLAPVADTYVQASLPATNFGTAGSLVADGSPITNAYLRFDVSVPAGESVTSATLRVFATKKSSGFTIHAVSDTTWGETTTTYANAPAIGAQVAASGSHSANAYVSVDVTSLVSGSGLVSLALKRSSGQAVTLSSREAASNPPQLIVDSSPTPPPPPPPPPPPSGDTVAYALGDGADGSTTSLALANYVQAQNPDRFFYLGDVYESGTATEFATKYDPLYGPLASITDPVIGNHESGNRTTGYYPYWQGKRGWTQEQAMHRSYVDADSGWQVIAYDSNANMTSEGAWVAGEVAKHAGTCRIVMSHHGRHVVVDTSHNDNTNQEPVWSAIIDKTAINLVGHNHIYGRLAPLNGVNVIVSGAGGHGLRTLGTQHHTVAASKVLVATATKLVLRPGAADFSQVDKDGNVHDSGTVSCTPA